MYQIINENIIKVLGAIDKEKDIDPYLKMAEMFSAGSVSDNDEYKTIYRKYWQLNAARLSDHYCNHYFQVMEDHRHKDQIDIEAVVKALYEVPSNSKGIKTIQFSFATKLLHTIDNTRPVYDSLVGDFYFFPQIKPTWKYGKKLSAYTRAYTFLLSEYKRILDKGLLSESLQQFRERFRPPDTYTDQKIVDTLLWKFGSYVRNGAIMSGKIQYS
jgi:hypothetical protein